MEGAETGYWIRTVGAQHEGDPRDGELHRMTRLPDAFDLEPLDSDLNGEDAHYVRVADQPDVDEVGRQIWRFNFCPQS